MSALLATSCERLPDQERTFQDTRAFTIRANLIWDIPASLVGVSSPQITDINKDGVQDIILGGGQEDKTGSISAFDGKTGEMLWTCVVSDEVVATTSLLDITGDGIPEVFLTGRKLIRRIAALNGSDGKPIWILAEQNPEEMFPSTNFGSPILVPDLDGDGLDDLVFIQSGGRDAIRPHARIYHVGSATGRIVKTLTSPDRREIYSMPSLVRSANDNNHLLYLGTGGETRPGHMFCLDFPSMQERWRFASTDKGFIASPILHDFENRGYHDVVDTAFNGSLPHRWGKWGAGMGIPQQGV